MKAILSRTIACVIVPIAFYLSGCADQGISASAVIPAETEPTRAENTAVESDAGPSYPASAANPTLEHSSYSSTPSKTPGGSPYTPPKALPNTSNNTESSAPSAVSLRLI